MPNMSQMTIGNVTYDLKDTEGRAHVVEVSNTKPVHEDNKIWIKDQENEYVVPSYDEFEDLEAALSSFKSLESEAEATNAVVGTKSYSSMYTALPVTLVDGEIYHLEFTLVSSAIVNIALHSSTSAATKVETLADNLSCESGTQHFIFKKTSQKKHIRITDNSGALLPNMTLTFTKIRLDTLPETISSYAMNLYSNLVDFGEALSNMETVSTATTGNVFYTAIPAVVAYDKTYLVEFELANDAEKFYLALHQTEATNTQRKIVYSGQALKAGKYSFVLPRGREINYLRCENNGAVVSGITFTFYGVEKNDIALQLRSYGNLVNSSNYSTRLPDLNNALTNTTYICFVSTSGYPAHLPILITGYTSFVVFTLQENTNRYQFFVHSGRLFSRTYNGTAWTDWASFYDYIPHYYVVDPSYTDGQRDNSGSIRYSTLCGAIVEAIKYPHSTIEVNAGTYDILSEYQTLYPDDWSTRNDGRGINLNNDVHIIFSSKALVACNYTGSDESVLTNFSAFNVRYGSATIENANIEANRIRYCVHDDMFSSASPYHVKYKNCIMKIDNSQNPYRSQYPHCIGGGFGQNSHISIENCVFEGIGGNGSTNPAPADNAIVNWHNGPNASQKSDLFMSGCYFRNSGTFGASSHGNATEISTLLISGNSFGSPIIDRDQITAPAQRNIEIIAFNNEVRN